MIDPDDPLIFGVPRSWRRRHSGLPDDLADAGFSVLVVGVLPEMRYRLVQGHYWRSDREHVQSPVGTLDECIAWARAWLATGGVSQQTITGGAVAVLERR